MRHSRRRWSSRSKPSFARSYTRAGRCWPRSELMAVVFGRSAGAGAATPTVPPLAGARRARRRFGDRGFREITRAAGLAPLVLVAVPLGVGAAIYLAELAPRAVRPPVTFLVEMLAAIPSVVYGLWGIFVLAPWLRTWVQPALGHTLGFLPLFQGPPYGVGMLAAGLILAIMIVPFITAVSREVLLAVPRMQREAALALGATGWETTRIAVLRYGRSGLIGAVLLGLGRALGETMAVTT